MLLAFSVRLLLKLTFKTIMTNKSIASLCLFVTLTGCVSSSKQFINDSGQIISCNASGFGIIGAPVAASNARECEEKQIKAGYKSLEQNPTTVDSIPPTSASTVTSKDGTFKYDLRDGWTNILPIPANLTTTQIQARNRKLDLFLTVSTARVVDYKDFNSFLVPNRERLVKALTNPSSSEVIKFTFNGMDSEQIQIKGTLNNGVNVKYMITDVKGDTKIFHIVASSIVSKFDENIEEIKLISNGLNLK